jgi:hypothetical protein
LGNCSTKGLPKASVDAANKLKLKVQVDLILEDANTPKI